MLRRNKPGQLQRTSHEGGSASGARDDARAASTRTGLVTHTAAQRPTESAASREPFTYVHRGTVIIGEVVATGRVRVHGEIRGDVKIDGVLEVAESGSVDGALVEAREVKVLGRVKADVVAGGKVEIWKGGVLIGDVRASALDIEEGATFNGFSHMRAEGVAAAGDDYSDRRDRDGSEPVGAETDTSAELEGAASPGLDGAVRPSTADDGESVLAGAASDHQEPVQEA